MKFTQFIFPHGRKEEISIEVAPDIEKMAQELVAAGYAFEIECQTAFTYPGAIVYMDCCNAQVELANEACENGPRVPEKVVSLVKKAYQRFKGGA